MFKKLWKRIRALFGYGAKGKARHETQEPRSLSRRTIPTPELATPAPGKQRKRKPLTHERMYRRTGGEKLGRNDRCFCRSERKFKDCHLTPLKERNARSHRRIWRDLARRAPMPHQSDKECARRVRQAGA